MRKKTFQVLITTTFEKVVEVKAEDEEEAINLVDEMLFKGEIEDGVTTEEPNTELSIW